MARQRFPGDNNDMQETVFGVPLLLITCWIAYLIKLVSQKIHSCEPQDRNGCAKPVASGGYSIAVISLGYGCG